MERSGVENKSKSSEDGSSGTAKESSSRSSSKEKLKSSTASKEKESEKSTSKTSHSRSSKTEHGASSKSHQKLPSKSKDDKGTSKSGEDLQKSSSSHRSSTKEESKSSHFKHKAGETKHSDSKSSHRSSKEKSESSSKQTHRSSSKDDGKSSSRHGHRSSDHKHSSSSSKVTGGEPKAKHSENLPAKDILKVNPNVSSDNKSSRSHASHKDSEFPSADEPKSSKAHEHTKIHNSSDSKSREPSKHSHRSSSKSDKSKDKSQRDAKTSESQRSHREKSDSKSTKPYEETSTKNSGTTEHPPAAATSKHRPSSQTNPLPPPENKPNERDRSKSKTSGAPVEIVPTTETSPEKSSTTKTLFSKNQAPKSDKIVYSREGTKPDSELRTGKTDITVSGVHSGKKPHRQEAKIPDSKRQKSSSRKDTVKRARSSPSSADPRDSKRSKLDVPEKNLRQEGSLADSAKKRLKKDSGTGVQSDLYVSVKLAAIKRNAPAGKFQVEGLTAKGRNSNSSQAKKSVHFGGVQKFYIERRKKVRFAKVVATYKWPMSRKIKFVKLKKSADSTNSKKTHKHKKLPGNDKNQKKKVTGIKTKANKEIAASKKSINWQEKHKSQKSHTGKSDKTKPLTSSKAVKSNDPNKIVETPIKIKSSPIEKLKSPSLDNALQEKCKQQNKVKESNDNSKTKTEKILPSTSETSKTDKSKKCSVSEITSKKKSSSKRKAVNKKSLGSKKELKGKSKKASKYTGKPMPKRKKSVLWKIPKKLSVKRLKIAIQKKIQKRSVYLIQIKKLTRVVKIEKAIRKLTRSVNKLTKPKDLLKIQKEIKRLIKIKSGLIKLNKVFNEKLIKRARKAKRIKKKGMLKKKKTSPKKNSIQSKKLHAKGDKRNEKSNKSSKSVKKSDKISLISGEKDKFDKKPVKPSKATPKLPKSKDKVAKAKIVGEKSGDDDLNAQAKPLEKKVSKPSKKKDEVSHKVKKKSPSDKGKVIAQKVKKSSRTSALLKTKSKKSKRKGTLKKVKAKVTPRSCWKSKKTSKEIKRYIRKLHENFYTAKNKGVTQKKRNRKLTHSERKIKSKKDRVRKLNIKIKQMQRFLLQHKNGKTLGRKQLINFANNRRLKPFSVRGKSMKKTANFKCLLMSQNIKMLRNLDCAHFRMIHDTQNVCVVKSRWGKFSQIKSDENKCISSKRMKSLKRLNSNFIECFRQVPDVRFTILSSVDQSAKPYHLNSEEIYPQLGGCQTALHGTRPNGFGYFFCPDPSSMKIEKAVRHPEMCSNSKIRLSRQSVSLSSKMKTSSKKSALQTLIKKRQFPFEKVKLPPRQNSILGVVNGTQCQNAMKNRKRTPSTDLIRVKTQKFSTRLTRKKSLQKKLTPVSCKSKRREIRKLPPSGSKGPVLLKKIVAPFKRRVLCQKVLVQQRHSSQSTTKPSLKSVDKGPKTARSKLKFVASEEEPSYRWFLRREDSFMGYRYFLLAKRAAAPKSRWVLKCKQEVGENPEVTLIKKHGPLQPKWTLLKSTYNQAAKLVANEDLSFNENRLSRKMSSVLETKRTGKKLVVRKITTPENIRIVISRKTGLGGDQRRQQVLLQQKKPRILIKKRSDCRGNTQLIIYRESIPGKKEKVIKTQMYGPGVEPRIFVQKAIDGGQKPRIILNTQSDSSFSQKQIGYRFAESKEKFAVIRRELFPGKIFRVSKTLDSSLHLSQSKPKLFVQRDWPGMPRPLIIKHDWSFNHKTQYIINRESLFGQPSRFVIQQGNKSQMMVIKKLIPGYQPQILLRKVLVSDIESEYVKTDDSIPCQQKSSNASSRKLPNKMPVGKLLSKPPVVVRKSSFSSPAPLLITNRPVAPGQKSQVLVRREFVEKYNPVVLISSPIPGQKPQIIIRSYVNKPNANKQIISANSEESSLEKKSRLLRSSRGLSKLAKRCYRIIPKRWSAFHYTKIFSRKQICRRVKKKVTRKKISPRKTFKIFANRSRVLTNGLLKRYILQQLRKRRNAAKRNIAKYQNYPSKAQALKLRYAPQPKLKSTKGRKKLVCQTPSISVLNAGTPGKRPNLQISRKIISRNSTSVCILVKEKQPGQKPQIIIRRLPGRRPKNHGRRRKFATRQGIEKRPYLSLSYRKRKMRLKSEKKLTTGRISKQKIQNSDEIVIDSYANQIKAKPLINLPVQPIKTIRRVTMKSVAVGSPRDGNSFSEISLSEMSESDDNSTIQMFTKVIEMEKKEETLTTSLKIEPQQSSSLEINPAKRKFSTVIASPDKRVSKKRRTGTSQSKRMKPLKRINNGKDVHSNPKRKRKKRKLHQEFPFLLGREAAKLSADYLKGIGSRSEKYRGRNIFKVPKVPPPKKGSLPSPSESINSTEKLSNTYIAPKMSEMSGTSDITAGNKELGRNDIPGAPPIATISTTEHISNWQAYKERPKFLFENKSGEVIIEERKKPVFENTETSALTVGGNEKSLAGGTSSVTSTRKVLCNVLGYDSDTLNHVKSLRDSDRLTEEEKRLIIAGLTGFPNSKANSRPKSPPEPIPAIWAVPRKPRFPKTTVTSLLEKIARKNAAMNALGGMDMSEGVDTRDREEFPPIINEDLSDDEDDNEKSRFENETENSLMERHSISNILKKKRFALRATSPALSKLNTQKIFTEFSIVHEAFPKIERPIPDKEISRDTSPPSPVVDRTGKHKAVVSRGTEIDSALTSPEDMDTDSNSMFMENINDPDNTGVFKEEPVFSIRESENDFFIESTTNVGTQFDKLIYKSTPKEKYGKLPVNMVLPPVLIRHTISSFQRSVQKFKQNKIFRIAAFARKRGQKLALRNKLLRKRASNLQLRKSKLKLKGLSKANLIKAKGKVTPGSKSKEVKKKVPKSVLKVGRKKKQKAAAKPVRTISKKTTDKSLPPKKVALKSILKKPSFGMRKRRKVAPLKVLPKDFVLKSILKKKRIYPSHPGVARESSNDIKIPEPVKTGKKKVVISSILSPVPMHNDRKHSRCKHFKGLKISKVSKSSVPSGHSRAAESSKRTESSSAKHRRDGQAKSASSSSVAGCSKDVGSALPRIQATSTVFKVPAIPPASAKIRTNLPASGGSPSSSSLPAPSSSTYIAPQMPTPSELSLSGILSGSFKVPETPTANESLKRRQSSSSTSVSSKRRKHSSSTVKNKSPTPSSQPKVGENSPGYSSITLASLLKSSEFPVSKDSSHFKPLFDFSSKPVSPQTEEKSKSHSSTKISAGQKPQDPISEVKRISVPTKAQLKQVSPQPQNEESKTVDSGSKILDKDTKKVTKKATKSKSDNPKQAKGEKQKDKIPCKPTEKATPNISPSKPQCRAKKVSFDTNTSLIDGAGNTSKVKLIEHSATKPCQKGKKVVRKKKGKQNLKKCGHPKRKKKSRKVAKSSAKGKTSKKAIQKKPELKKPLNKVQLALAKLKFKKLRKSLKQKEGPKFKVKYKKEQSASLSRTRLRVLTSLYSKYEQIFTRVNKIRREQRIIKQRQNASKIVCPNFQQELHYWNKAQLSTKFIRKLNLSKQKYFEGTTKIMAKSTCNKLSIAYNTSQLLAQKVIKKYGVNKLLSKNISKHTKKHSSQMSLLSALRKSDRRKKKSKKSLNAQTPGKSDGQSNIATKGPTDGKRGKKASSKVVDNKSPVSKGTPNAAKKINSNKPKPAKLLKKKLIKKAVKNKVKKPIKQKPLESGAEKIRRTKIKEKISRISTKSKVNFKKTRKPSVSQRSENSNKLRLLKHDGKIVPVPNEKQMALSTLFVPKRNGFNVNMEIAKPFVVVPAKTMVALNRLGMVINKAENAGVIKDWMSYMLHSHRKPPPPKLSRASELITKVPCNAYIMHSIQLQRHKRELDDRIIDLKEKGLAMKIGPMPKLPPVPKGFVEEETTPMDRATVEQAITQRLCLSIAHGGFTHSNTNALDMLSLAVQHFYRNFCKNLKETVHRNNSHLSIGFPDAMDRVLTEKGFGGVRGLEDYYNTEIMSRHKSLQNIAAVKRVEYASILRNSIGLSAHIPVTPEDFAESEVATAEPSPPASAEETMDTSSKNEEVVWVNPNQLPGDRDIVELIYDLETDVLKSSQNVMTHEVMRPRFLEYQEPCDTPQRRLEIICVPIAEDLAPLVEESMNGKHGGEQGKETENLADQNGEAGPEQGANAQSSNWLLAHALRQLTVTETHLFAQWRRMAMTLRHSANMKPTVMVMGKEVPTSSLTSEQTLFAKAIDIKSRLQMTLRNHEDRENIAKSLDPKIVQFLRMAEVARKVVLIARRAKLQLQLAGITPNLHQNAEGQIVNQATNQRNNEPSSSALAITGASSLAIAGPSNWGLQRSSVNPQSRVETQTRHATLIPRNASPAEMKARQELLAKQLAALPGTSSAAMKEANERLSLLKSFGHKISLPNPQLSNSSASNGNFVANVSSSKRVSLSRAGKTGQQKMAISKAYKQSLLKYKGKNPKLQRKKSIESQRVDLLFKISTFIQKLPQETRSTALTRNPNLVRVLRNENCLLEVLKQHPKLAVMVKRPRNRKTLFDRRSGYASFTALRRNQIKVFDREAMKMKIAALRRNQWKSQNPKHKFHKIKTLRKNEGVCKNPMTKKQKIVRVITENVQVTNINKGGMKVVYPNSNTEKNVFMNPRPVATTSRPKTKAAKLKSNQTRITDANKNDSKIISMQRGIVLRRRDTVHQAPSNKVTIFDKDTRKQKLLHLTINQVAVINPLTRKIKVRDLKSNEAKILDPVTKRTQLVMLNSNQIKTYDEKSNTVRIISFQEERVMDPKTLQPKPLNLKQNEVTVVDPVTKGVKIVDIGKLKPVHSHAMNMNPSRSVQNDCLMLSPASNKEKSLPPLLFPQRGINPADRRVMVPSKTTTGFFRSPIPSAISVSYRSGKRHEEKKKAKAPKPPDSQKKSVDKFLTLSRTRAYVESLPAPAIIASRGPGELAANKLSTPEAPRSTDCPLQTVDPKSDLSIRKPLSGEAAGKAVNVLPIHPSTSLLRPINPNLPQFSKTSLIQVGPNASNSKGGTSLPTRELPSSSKSFPQDIPPIGPSGYKTQSISDNFNQPHIIQANVPTKTQPLKPEGSGTPSVVAFTSQRPTYGYSPDIFNIKTGGGVTGQQLPLTPLHPLLTAARISQGLPTDSSPQHLKVAYRVPQASMAPIIPHSSLTIISSAEHALMFDTSKQSNLSQTKIAFSSSSVLGRPVQGPTTADSVLYNLSPTKEERKNEKGTARASSSATSSSLKSSSRYSDSSSTKSSKTSKTSSRPSDSGKSSRSTKEKSSSRSSESKSSSSGSSKSSSKHHESKHSSSSSKSHRDPSLDAKKSKHHKSHEAASPEPKQPAKRGRPPKRPAPTTPPKKTKGSRHSTPESTDESVSSRKHAKYH